MTTFKVMTFVSVATNTTHVFVANITTDTDYAVFHDFAINITNDSKPSVATNANATYTTYAKAIKHAVLFAKANNIDKVHVFAPDVDDNDKPCYYTTSHAVV